jgi:glycosyltransferase involved in cell wall biosynthesis
MTILRVIVDDMLSGDQSAESRYAQELTREIIRTAPRGCAVEGFVSASTEPQYADIIDRLPGLAALHKSALERRELMTAWQHGFTRLPGSGMVHATSLFAPLARHDRLNAGEQIAVTVHDTLAWTHPESLSPRLVSWHKGMAKRAQKHADAIVVPSHAVAAQLDEILHLGDRVRVISSAPSSTLVVPPDADDRAAALNLPSRYVMAIGSREPHRGLDLLIAAMASPDASDIPLVIAGSAPSSEVSQSESPPAGILPETRIRHLGEISDSDFAVVLDRATVFVLPSRAEGFGAPVLEAMRLGTPVVHSDAPALMEIADDAGVAVALADESTFSERLAAAISRVVDDPMLAKRLAFTGVDRAKAFTWRNAAEKVWQLHADL